MRRVYTTLVEQYMDGSDDGMQSSVRGCSLSLSLYDEGSSGDKGSDTA
jgi:hypothetical protein